MLSVKKRMLRLIAARDIAMSLFTGLHSVNLHVAYYSNSAIG